jgi:NAD(P)-dependent dehydrogenase (short-subunit alcohol dehydrogenase family)
MAPGGTIIHVSSIYTLAPPPKFAHYVAAKSAVDGLLRALAQEHPSLRFVNLHAPRMLTDQTNLPYDTDPPVSAISVAMQALAAIAALPAEPNLHDLP